MQPAIRQRRRGVALARGLLVALTVFGVLSMHSVTSTPSTNTSMSMGAHLAMAPSDSSIPVAFGEHDCPSVHQMMHPCAGTTVSWPALTVPAMSGGIELAPTTVTGMGGRTESSMGRDPPWTLSQLDKSVTLRV
ncbi:hypothetical protein [Rhodococcus sovatensis]|uniref:Uncharacterized protein n=1 Tax=Rhodococcus sovatensis TaxID=1805840 RepID=A0ABZ2PII4_9NOCA